ncbi:MAG: hypothetical protein PHZ04_00620 [Patescibacteria group bacterium]|nr:hypothetical protein [Patescibacteria group bacterium]MDD5294829.1 hypothetical protein [Patescibacteria group bacterium]MDD5554733.1 hypothetical protein [Patescibacteria group bacterium]
MKSKNTMIVLIIVLVISVILNIYWYTKQSNMVKSLQAPGNIHCSCDWSGCSCDA